MNTAVEAKNLEGALAHIANGGRLAIPTHIRCTIIDQGVIARFEKAGQWLLKEEGDGYRLRTGKTSVYVLPGQLKYA
jgi:hypothetical protein